MSNATPDAGGDARLIAGRYRLHRELGRGSMGVVWEGYDEVLHRAVAVKEVLLPGGLTVAEAAEARERTMREARAIAALTHPHVVAVYDVAKEGDDPFVVMELLPSRSLASLVARHGRCNNEQAAQIADAVAAALDAAHRHGIVHRDVKPGNVLVGDDGQVKLSDFGIARNVAEATLTESGLVLGTPAFIAPEMISEDAVTPATDLWGLGATLFAAVEGYPPYDEGNALETVQQVVHGQIPRPRPDAPLADVISALMVREPAARMSLVEVRRRIRGLLPEPGQRVFPVDGSDSMTARVRPVPAPELPGSAGLAGTPGPAAPPSSPAPLAASPGPLPFASGPAPLAASPAPLAPSPAPLVSSSAPLASSPGPLPFVTTPLPPSPLPARPQRRRGRVAAVGVVALAVVAFLTAAAGGFAAARALGGASLLPVSPADQPSTSAPPTIVLRPSSAEVVTTSGQHVGTFTVDVPFGWLEFVEPRWSKALPASTAVRFVSPDGTATVTVELFKGFYPSHSIQEYLTVLNATWHGYFVMELSGAIPSLPGGGPEAAREITYRTTEASGTTAANVEAASARRTTYADLLPSGNDLWIVSVTVRTDQEGSGQQNLFDKIKSTFQVTGSTGP